MKRRDFLKQTAFGAAASAGLGVPQCVLGFAPRRRGRKEEPQQPERIPIANPVLVVIFLRGGQDQLNSIIPYTDKTYYEVRPTVSIPKEYVVKVDKQWGFHPSMAPVKPFYDQGRLAFVINSGSPHPTRSHFDAQDFMDYAAPGLRIIRDGWLNRYLIETGKKLRPNPERIRAIAMQELLPRSLRGEVVGPIWTKTKRGILIIRHYRYSFGRSVESSKDGIALLEACAYWRCNVVPNDAEYALKLIIVFSPAPRLVATLAAVRLVSTVSVLPLRPVT